MQTQVLIIGGGITGAGIARDLALRGINCILVERRDINAGASGSNHGLLHSGARYVSGDMSIAAECQKEAKLLKELAPQCIEDTGGLFVAVPGDDENYVSEFPGLCKKCGIPIEKLDVQDALEMEPALSEEIFAAYQVNDAAVDPFRLSLENITHAQHLGARLLRNTEVVGFKKSKGRIRTTLLRNRITGKESVVEADQVVNATGAWAGQVAALAGASIDVTLSKGSLLILDKRISGRVINRLRPSSNADILVPGGTVSILGTTSVVLKTLDDIRPTIPEVDAIVAEASAMLPVLTETRYLRAYAGVRPLIAAGTESDARTISRGFALIDHKAEGLENFTTISGGKLTTYRLMAEKTSNVVCDKLGIWKPCRTRTEPLPVSSVCRWTIPGLAPKEWLGQDNPKEMLLCECEMVPHSAVDSIVGDLKERNDRPDLRAIGLRSRIGKGTCQGVFCGVRVTAYLYDKGVLNSDQGLVDLKSFLRGRWKGIRPILWGTPLVQEELQEALHCGLFGLEL